jgi:hypothetical protein
MYIAAPMLDETRLDGKLLELARELMARPMIPGYIIADAYTTRGLDETGKPGLFAAILLGPSPTPELNTLTIFRQMLTAKLKQVDTRTPAFPIVVQGAPEVIDSHSVVPGGREVFEQVKVELMARRERLHPTRVPLTLDLPPMAASSSPSPGRAAPAKAVKKAKKAPPRLSAKTVRKTSSKTAARRR